MKINEDKVMTSIFMVLITGCQIIVPNNWQGTCTIRPIAVTRNGVGGMHITKWREQVDITKSVYKLCNMNFMFLSTEIMEIPNCYDITNDNIHQLSELSMTRCMDNRELIVFIVNTITYNGKPWGGLAFYPDNKKNSLYQHGVFIIRNPNPDAMAHELGHAFGLRHPWNDTLADTPSSGPADCPSCNIMSYCVLQHSIKNCASSWLSQQQINTVQKWASVVPRNQVVSSNVIKTKSLITYTNGTEPSDSH